MASTAEISYSREMGVTHADFFRLLPAAMGEHEYTTTARSVSGKINAGTVRMELGEQQHRRIALLAIPYIEVTFIFNGISEAEQQAFKAHFDLYFQRGGG